MTWNAEESAKFDNVGLAGEWIVSGKSIISTEQTPQIPFHSEHNPSEDAPTAKLVFSHEWTLHFRTRAPLLLYNTRANTGGK